MFNRVCGSAFTCMLGTSRSSQDENYLINILNLKVGVTEISHMIFFFSSYRHFTFQYDEVVVFC